MAEKSVHHNSLKKNFHEKHHPIEPHDTAAWANIEKIKPDSHVPMPNVTETINAKEWVDANEK